MRRAAWWLWLLAMAALLALFYRHLGADFPNYSPWSDWEKFTDEGWYANGAVQHFLGQSWYQPGDFNAAVALPVWQVLAAAVFRFTGVSLVAIRALAVTCFAAALVAQYFFLKHWLPRAAAALSVTLLAGSAYCYAFSRQAILEPATLLGFSLLLLVCSRARLRSRACWVAAGILLAVMVFTKTTSIVLVPAALVLVWRRSDGERWLFVRACGLAALGFVVPAAAYLLLVRLHGYWPDFTYLFTSNRYTLASRQDRWAKFLGAFRDGEWVGDFLYVGAALVLIAGLTFYRRLRANPLFGCCAVWLLCGFSFIAWHANMQPRYYYTLTPAMAALIALALSVSLRQRQRLLAGIMAWAVLVCLAIGVTQIVRWQRRPEYTFRDAADALAATMQRDGGRNQFLMSISSSQLSLMTGVRSINDDFGTDDLEVRIARYDPGWYASWDDPDPGTLESLNKFYTLKKMGAWPAMDDPDRHVLTLFRLDPLPVRLWHPGDIEQN